MSRPARGHSRARLNAATVREATQGRWRWMLSELGISVPNNPKQQGPCPICGGRDRFHFDDLDGRGTWFCRQCIPQAGDGLQLVKNALRLDFRGALACLAKILGIHSTPQARPHRPVPPIPPPPRVDRQARAFQFELAALDLRIRAGQITEASKGFNLESVTDAELDHAIELVARGYADIAMAELFEHVADTLRLKAFLERTQSDGPGRPSEA